MPTDTQEQDRSDTQTIDATHQRRPFHAHGLMDVVTLGAFTLGRGLGGTPHHGEQ